MLANLLSTKLHAPTLRTPVVSRTNLVEQINQGMLSGNKLTLLSAPAGFGKTTLVLEWLSQALGDQPSSPERGRLVSWLSLDKGDNDPARFLTYLAAAIEKIQPGTSEVAIAMLRSPQPIAIEPLLTFLLNELSVVRLSDSRIYPSVLVLDDYHQIASQRVHDAVTFLLEYLPAQIHLLITCRSDPPLPLARLRVQGQMTEIRQADLRFTTQEATIFFNDVMALSLPTDEVGVLESRTEGWIAGLQLAAISLRGREDVAEFVATFSGSHRFVMDYLTDEVMRQLDEGTRNFLYQTSILKRFTAGLCDALTGQSNSQEILAELEQENLFVVPLDDERRWYRYHHLFADLLSQRLEVEQPGETTMLHSRAAQWFEHHGSWTEAMEHWLASGDLEQAARLLETEAMAALNRGEMSIVMQWLAAFPEELVAAHPWLSVTRAWTALLSGRMENILDDLANATSTAIESFHEDNVRQVAGHAAAIQAYYSLMMGDVVTATEQAQESLEKLPQNDKSTRSVVTYTLGGACLMKEDIEGACKAFAEAGAAGRESGNFHLAVSALSALGALQMQCGRLHQAFETFDQAKRLATSKLGRVYPFAASACGGLGSVLYEWGRIEEAESQLATAVKLAETWGNIDSLVSSHVRFCQVLLAQGNVENARSQLQFAESVARGKQLTPTSEAFLVYQRVRMALVMGDVAGAIRIITERQLESADGLSYVREKEYLALAVVLLAQDECDRARALLDRMLVAAEGGGRLGQVVQIQVLLAISLQRLGDSGASLAHLEAALSLAEPEGFVWTFFEVGEGIHRLLSQAASQGSQQAYARKLLSVFPQAEPGISPEPAGSKLELAGHLTEYEIKVLRLVSAGLSNRQIGEELYLSTNTIKWHLKNIYQKLYVHSRVEAVTRAQELGLL